MKLMLNGKEVTGMGHYVIAGDIKDATAEDSNVLSGKAYYNNNGKREGTMPNRGGVSAELAAGGSVSIPEGYHNGEGVVRAQDLASQTQGDAGAGNIDSGKTAWVNGVQVTGTSTKVDTSGATATAADIASGKTAWVNGSKVTGTGKMDPWKVLQSIDLTSHSQTSYSAMHLNSWNSYLRFTDKNGGHTMIYALGIKNDSKGDALLYVPYSNNSHTVITFSMLNSSQLRIQFTGGYALSNFLTKVEEVSLA